MSEFSFKNIILNSGNVVPNNKHNNRMKYTFGVDKGVSNSQEKMVNGDTCKYL